MYIIKKFLALLLAFFVFGNLHAQTSITLTPARIAVLAPLNLDSAFNGYEYNLGTTYIPSYFLSGLEFYNGVQMAIDSLQQENANIEVWIYDTHKKGQSMEALTQQMQVQNFNLIIASLSNVAEQKVVSDFSIKNSIPVISATYPNNAALNYNPFFAIVNPTWETHIQAIYDYLHTNYSNKKIVYVTRDNPFENTIWKKFEELNKDNSVVFKKVVLSDNFSPAQLQKQLDSTTKNVVLCGSLNEGFGKSLIRELNADGITYNTTLIGMPTWYGMLGTTGSAVSNIDIYITTPYNYSRTQPSIAAISNEYKQQYFAKPSDMVFKGFEMMYHFTKLLLQYPDNFINKISDDSSILATQFDFEPVRLNSTSFVPDYQENKKIYFVHIANGNMVSMK